MKSSIPSEFLMEWWFKDDHGVDVCLQLRADENSSPDELEDEAEYWMTQARVSGLEGAHKKAVMEAVRWLMTVAEKNGS